VDSAAGAAVGSAAGALAGAGTATHAANMLAVSAVVPIKVKKLRRERGLVGCGDSGFATSDIAVILLVESSGKIELQNQAQGDELHTRLMQTSGTDNMNTNRCNGYNNQTGK
jgi:ABC-type microcin C transport system duplicated ATPase subunit YejF